MTRPTVPQYGNAHIRKLGVLFAGNDLNYVELGQNEQAIADEMLRNMAWFRQEWAQWGTEVIFLDCIPPYCQDT